MLLGLKPEWQVPDKHFCPATPMSGERTLHLYYSLLNIQKEVEKRTYYLGSKRAGATEKAPHLLDLIGMSRDEADVLYPFAKAAMADVFDALNQSTVGLPKLYNWEDKKNILSIKHRLHATGITNPSLTPTQKTDKIYITGTVSIPSSSIPLGGVITQAVLTGDVARPNLSVTLTYTTKRSVIATGGSISIPHTDTFVIGKDGIFPFSPVSTNYDSAISYMHLLDLKPQDGIYTREELDTSATITATCTVLDDWEFVNPIPVTSGVHFKVENANTPTTEYEADTDFDENDLIVPSTSDDPILTFAHLANNADNFLEEGIHYYIAFPNYLNDSLIAPLDNAILEALVNRVIWKWICIAYPEEAQAYDTFYQQALVSLKTRCNIFSKNWAERTPRIY